MPPNFCHQADSQLCRLLLATIDGRRVVAVYSQTNEQQQEDDDVRCVSAGYLYQLTEDKVYTDTDEGGKCLERRPDEMHDASDKGMYYIECSFEDPIDGLDDALEGQLVSASNLLQWCG